MNNCSIITLVGSICFVFILLMISIKFQFNESSENKVEFSEDKIGYSNFCDMISSNKTYMDDIYTITDRLSFTSNKYRKNSDIENETIETLLDRIIKSAKNMNSNQNSSSNIKEVYIRQNSSENLNLDNENLMLKDIKSRLPKKILNENSLDFFKKMEFLDTIKGCLNLFIKIPKDCYSDFFSDKIKECVDLSFILDKRNNLYIKTPDNTIINLLKGIFYNVRVLNRINARKSIFDRLNPLCCDLIKLEYTYSKNHDIIESKNKLFSDLNLQKHLYSLKTYCRKSKQERTRIKNFNGLISLKKPNPYNFGNVTDPRNFLFQTLFKYYTYLETIGAYSKNVAFLTQTPTFCDTNTLITTEATNKTIFSNKDANANTSSIEILNKKENFTSNTNETFNFDEIASERSNINKQESDEVKKDIIYTLIDIDDWLDRFSALRDKL